MNIYIDNDFKCYLSHSDDRQAVETNAFAKKDKHYIESFRFIPEGQSWTNPDGRVVQGETLFPWRDPESAEVKLLRMQDLVIANSDMLIDMMLEKAEHDLGL